MRGTGTASSGQQDSKEGELFSNRVICLAVLLLSRHHSHTVLFVRASEGSLDWLPQVMTPSPADTVGGVRGCVTPTLPVVLSLDLGEWGLIHIPPHTCLHVPHGSVRERVARLPRQRHMCRGSLTEREYNVDSSSRCSET